VTDPQVTVAPDLQYQNVIGTGQPKLTRLLITSRMTNTVTNTGRKYGVIYPSR